MFCFWERRNADLAEFGQSELNYILTGGLCFMATYTHEERRDKGSKAFARLVCRLMEGNCWSHPKMIKLSKASMGGIAWLHSSQISGLLHAKLNPNPRVFKAIQVLNESLFNYATKNQLIPGTTSSNDYSNAICIKDETGGAPSTGWFVEVFTGERDFLPNHDFWIDMSGWKLT